MLSTIPYTALLSPTPIFSSSSIAVLMFWPWPPMPSMHTLHFTLYTPYLTLLCLAPFQSFRVLPLLFLCFDPRPQCTSRTDHTLHCTLYTLPPQPSPCRLLCLTLLQSFLVILVLPLLFFCFDPPNARPCTDQGGIEPHRHPIATWYIGRKTDHGGHPKWLGNCLKLAGFGTLPPRPPILTSFAMHPCLRILHRNCSHTFRNRSPVLHVTQEHPSWHSMAIRLCQPVHWVPPVLQSRWSCIVVPFQSGDRCGGSGWCSRGSYDELRLQMHVVPQLHHVGVSINSQPHSNRACLQSVKNYEGNLRS